MQRIKTFLVVCFSMVIMGTTFGQNILSPAYVLTPSLLPDQALPVSGFRIPAWNAGLFSYHRIAGLGLILSSSDRILSSLQPVSFSVGGANTYGANAAAAPLLSPASSPQTLENDYYTRHFGFFCKRELEFEKKARIPLRFRLGSLEQCNALEGKR